VLLQELSLQRVDCSAECLQRALAQLAATRSSPAPLSKLRCVEQKRENAAALFISGISCVVHAPPVIVLRVLQLQQLARI